MKEEEARRRAEEERKQAILEAEAFGTEKEVKEIKQQVVEAPKVQARPVAKANKARRVWSAEITDKRIFLTAIVNGLIPIELINVNQSRLDEYARKYKDGMHMPGVKVISKLV